MIKAHFSERMVSSGISDVVFDTAYSQKTYLKKLMMTIIMMNMIITITEKNVY